MTGRNEALLHKWRSRLELVALIAFIVACGSVTWLAYFPRPYGPGTGVAPSRPKGEPPPPRDPLELADALVIGNAAAKLGIVAFSDFQCPYCAKFAHDTLPSLEEKYVRPGKILIAFRHLPLPIHRYAQKAAEAAECAAKQERFQEMHDALFSDQLHLTEQDLAARAEQVHLNVTTFAQCMAGTAAQKVKADVETAAKLNVSGTPTFFIGNVLQDGRLQAQYRLSGAQGFAAFQAFLDKLIAYPPSNPSQGQAKRPETR